MRTSIVSPSANDRGCEAVHAIGVMEKVMSVSARGSVVSVSQIPPTASSVVKLQGTALTSTFSTVQTGNGQRSLRGIGCVE